MVRENVHNLSKPVAKMERETIMLNSVNNQFSLKKRRKIRYLKVEHSFNPGRITKSHDQVWG